LGWPQVGEIQLAIGDTDAVNDLAGNLLLLDGDAQVQAQLQQDFVENVIAASSWLNVF